VSGSPQEQLSKQKEYDRLQARTSTPEYADTWMYIESPEQKRMKELELEWQDHQAYMQTPKAPIDVSAPDPYFYPHQTQPSQGVGFGRPELGFNRFAINQIPYRQPNAMYPYQQNYGASRMAPFAGSPNNMYSPEISQILMSNFGQEES
jgi:hypothetical protein